MPASFGVQGPGESTIASGCEVASASAGVSASLRRTSQRRAKIAQEVDEIESEAIVVVDQQDHYRILRRGHARVNERALPLPAPEGSDAHPVARQRSRGLTAPLRGSPDR